MTQSSDASPTGWSEHARWMTEVATLSDVSFALDGPVVPAIQAMTDSALVGDLVDMGRMSLSLSVQGVLGPEDMDGLPGHPPDPVLDALLFDYAIEVAPRREGTPDVVDMHELCLRVQDMRAAFGMAPSAPALACAVTVEASRRLSATDPVERADSTRLDEPERT
ncbi:MAG: hypothetical protein F4213_03275 [Boseongicola sp. SB0677_bin_26]|nr:hypothetical protein [Boseongicola sp. SB0665_bin_10]MYG25036.1 hypothetical protein [Boseongicola sp. SB0677_bin_26]